MKDENDTYAANFSYREQCPLTEAASPSRCIPIGARAEKVEEEGTPPRVVTDGPVFLKGPGLYRRSVSIFRIVF
eukprot:1066283-Prorocentrum_minimum.AAC.1